MSQGTSCSLAVFSHSGLLGDVRNAVSLGGYTFPVQKASEHSQTSGKFTPPFTPFPARVYTTDFLNCPTQEQMSFRFVSFPLS